MNENDIKNALDTLRNAIPHEGGPWELFVLSYGWVIAGIVSEKSEKDDVVVLSKAYVVRRWGTAEGLGQLAKDGAQESTKLDPLPETKIRVAHILFSMSCKELNK